MLEREIFLFIVLCVWKEKIGPHTRLRNFVESYQYFSKQIKMGKGDSWIDIVVQDLSQCIFRQMYRYDYFLNKLEERHTRTIQVDVVVFVSFDVPMNKIETIMFHVVGLCCWWWEIARENLFVKHALVSQFFIQSFKKTLILFYEALP